MRSRSETAANDTGSNAMRFRWPCLYSEGLDTRCQPHGAFWNAAEVLELRADGTVKCRTRGLGAREVTVKRSQLQLAPDEVEQPRKPESLASNEPRTWLDSTGEHGSGVSGSR